MYNINIKNIKEYCLLLTIFFIPFGYGMKIYFGLNMSMFFSVGILISFFLTLISNNFKIITNIVNYNYNYFVVFILLHSLFFLNKDNSNHHFIFTILDYLFIYTLSVNLNRKLLNHIIVLLSIAFIISFFVGYDSVKFYIDNKPYGGEGRVYGGFQNPNTFGTLAVLIAFLNIYLFSINKYKVLSLCFILISFLGVFKSGSRGALLVMLLSLCYVFIKIPSLNKKINIFLKSIFIFLCLLPLVPSSIYKSTLERINGHSIFGTSSSSTQESRIIIWQDYLHEWKDFIFVGVGKGNSLTVTSDYYHTFMQFIPHNKYLELFVEFGFIGFLLYFISFLAVIKIIVKYSNTYQDKMFMMISGTWLIYFLFGSYTNSRVLLFSFAISMAFSVMLKKENFEKENINC